MNPDGGVINLDKPAGISSARAVGEVKRMVRGTGLKVGHAGTLDPFATGVLLILVGRATRSSNAMMNQPKAYEATVRLGATSPTDDRDSLVTPTLGAQPCGREQFQEALGAFVGQIVQQPPIYSALKLGGRPAYKLARSGEVVKLEPRQVFVERIDLLDFNWPDAKISVHCGRGVYIRAIARDIGEKLGVGGYLTALRRTAVGSFTVAEGVTLEKLVAEGIPRHLHLIK